MNLYQNTTTNKYVSAIKVGFDVLPNWAMDKIRSNAVELLNTQEHLAKIGNVLVSKSDYVIYDGETLATLPDSEFSNNYSKIEYTDETAIHWEALSLRFTMATLPKEVTKKIDIYLGQAILDTEQLTNLHFIAMVSQEKIANDITLNLRYRLVAMAATDYIEVQSGNIPTINLTPTKINKVNFSLPQVPWGVIIPTGRCYLELYYVTNAEDSLLSIVDFEIDTDTGDIATAIKQLQQIVIST